MSGGHFNGQEFQLQRITEDFRDDENVKKDLPRLSLLLKDLGFLMKKIIKDYDYHISGDTIINDMPSFEKKAICKITDLANKTKEDHLEHKPKN